MEKESTKVKDITKTGIKREQLLSMDSEDVSGKLVDTLSS